jgi:glycerol-3-phosphate acyltransferase PlsY
VPAGSADTANAGLPTSLGLCLCLGLAVALLAGLAAIIGHDWPLYLRFRGARGLSTALGVLLIVFPLTSVCLLVCTGLGKLLR